MDSEEEFALILEDDTDMLESISMNKQMLKDEFPKLQK